MAKKPIRVLPNDDDNPRTGDWKVTTGRFAKNSTHDQKSNAIERAKRLGRKHFKGVIVHRANGTVQYGFEAKQDASYAQGVKLVRSD